MARKFSNRNDNGHRKDVKTSLRIMLSECSMCLQYLGTQHSTQHSREYERQNYAIIMYVLPSWSPSFVSALTAQILLQYALNARAVRWWNKICSKWCLDNNREKSLNMEKNCVFFPRLSLPLPLFLFVVMSLSPNGIYIIPIAHSADK